MNDILQLLDRSRATDEFRASFQQFVRTGSADERIRFNAGSPPVKVQRTIAKLLQNHAEFPVDHVEVEGRSGCEFFRGTLRMFGVDEERQIRFDWDCRWKAEQQGWTDAFGFPDQIRAAREFGYDCFRGWAELEPAQLQ